MLDRTTRGRTHYPVVTGYVPGNASHGSAFEAPFGTDEPWQSRQWRHQGENDENFAHDGIL